jgi:multicomponent Na+:H+ antiporter subunit D
VTPSVVNPWVPWLVMAPLAGVMLSFLVPRFAVGVGLATSAAVAGASGLFVAHVVRHGATAYAIGGWGAPLGIEFVADGLSAWLVALSAVVGVAVSVYAVPYFGGAPGEGGDDEAVHERRYFWPLWLFLWAGLNALFVSGDVFNLYVTLELLGFSAVALVALAGTRDAITAAMRYMLASLLGSLSFLLGVALVYGAYATLDLSRLAEAPRSDPATLVALTLMTAGLMIKGAAFPLHFWLPPAHSSAPAPVSALLSALVVKAPFAILARLWFDSFASLNTPALGAWLGALGTAALVWGGILALRQGRLKLLVAYSTVAQLGYLFLIFPLAREVASGFTAWSGVMFFVAAHAAAKAAMFLAAGNVMRALGHDDLDRLAGLSRVLPRSVFALALAGVSLMGLPPSGGFIAKWLLLHAAITRGEWWWVAGMLVGTALAIAYIMRVVARVLAEPSMPLQAARVPAPMEWAALSLALLAALMGLGAAWPFDLLRLGAPVAGPLLFGGAP